MADRYGHVWHRSPSTEGGAYCSRCAQPKIAYWMAHRCEPEPGDDGPRLYPRTPAAPRRREPA